MPTDAPVKFGRYSLIRRIATGGMAEIFLAKQQGPGRFERSLVIKRILPHLAADPKFVTMFLDEAALAAQLQHPCIAQVYDFGEESGSYFIALELVRGPDLRTVIAACQKTNTAISPPIAVRLLTQVLAALDYAHHAVDERGESLRLVHRDVSPQNVLVSFDGIVKLVDFGIAKAANASSNTEAGVVKGKYSYFAPEQLARVPLDGRCDLYAAALVLYELLTLQKAIPGEGPEAIAAAMAGDITPIYKLRTDLPPRLVNVLGKALQRNREDRFPDCRAMTAELDAQLIEWNTSVPAQEIAEFLEALQGSYGEPLSVADTGSHPSVSVSFPAAKATDTVLSASGSGAKSAPSDPQKGIDTIIGEFPSPEAPPTVIRDARPRSVPKRPNTDPIDVADTINRPARPAAASRPRVSHAVEAQPPKSRASRPAASPIDGSGEVPLRVSRGSARWVVLGLAVAAVAGAAMFASTRSGPAPSPPPAKPLEAPPSETAQAAPQEPAPTPVVAAVPAASPAAAPATSSGSSGGSGGAVAAAPSAAPTTPAAPAEAAHGPAAAEPAPSKEVAEAPTAAEPEPEPKPERPERARRHPKPKVGREVAAVESAPASAGPAKLTVASSPWTDVKVDGAELGQTPVIDAVLAAGHHSMVLENGPLGIKREVSLDLEAGQQKKMAFHFDKGTLRFIVRPWANVTLDGKKLGATPLPEQAVYEGTHKVVLTNPKLGKTVTRTVHVVAAQTAELKVDLSQP